MSTARIARAQLQMSRLDGQIDRVYSRITHDWQGSKDKAAILRCLHEERARWSRIITRESEPLGTLPF